MIAVELIFPQHVCIIAGFKENMTPKKVRDIFCMFGKVTHAITNQLRQLIAACRKDN